ncbi:hypothetical protein [Clostridium sp. ZS2-4]|uniref:hypothetical protein n=1 Tax=Clostridium sp. ZS2-4 TaxID=2987703 RepID=UPI00227ADE55|nr:hypothetical protein [Clostridium sp. ZS2-4]MCY6355426.1 hypothetical protein [Clostridium sp. ZS2-4]
MSKKSKCNCCCCCGYGNRGGNIGNVGCGCGGFDPCKLALFLLVLKRANIIDNETGTLLVFLFLLCCGGFRKQGICC